MKDPGSAAPQCGHYDDISKEGRSEQQLSWGQERTGMERSKHRGWYSRGYLPHFDSPYVIQHITYRLADSLPGAVLEQMKAEAESSVRDDEKRKAELRQRIEIYLYAGHGPCVLQMPEIAACGVDTWHHFDGERYRLLEWVVIAMC